MAVSVPAINSHEWPAPVSSFPSVAQFNAALLIRMLPRRSARSVTHIWQPQMLYHGPFDENRLFCCRLKAAAKEVSNQHMAGKLCIFAAVVHVFHRALVYQQLQAFVSSCACVLLFLFVCSQEGVTSHTAVKACRTSPLHCMRPIS